MRMMFQGQVVRTGQRREMLHSRRMTRPVLLPSTSVARRTRASRPFDRLSIPPHRASAVCDLLSASIDRLSFAADNVSKPIYKLSNGIYHLSKGGYMLSNAAHRLSLTFARLFPAIYGPFPPAHSLSNAARPPSERLCDPINPSQSGVSAAKNNQTTTTKEKA